MTKPLRCVIDTNVYIKHLIPDPLSNKVDELLAHLAHPKTEILIPDLVYIECANTIQKYIRAGLYALGDLPSDLIELKALPFQVVSTADLMLEAVTIGVSNNITAYDACYVALSQQASAPLLTLDQKLVKALAGSTYDVRSFDTFSVPPIADEP